MSYALLGGCQYESRFTTDNGEITLWIEPESSLSCFVMLSYKIKIIATSLENTQKMIYNKF